MKKIFLSIVLICLLTYNSIIAFASPTQSVEALDEMDNADTGTVVTNKIANWPSGPDLNAEAAILMEANTGVILYAKNIHEHLYPASTTKLMTVLIASENSNMKDMVTFSHNAVFSLEAGSSNIGIDPGQSMTMEQCLYGIMVGSANEVANAVAEHVGGSIEGFVEMMNKKADEMGLKDTHFMNTNGLQDEQHYTSAYDLAVIAAEYFQDEHRAKIANTPSYHFEATSTQPDDFYVRNKHKLINKDIAYTGIKGGKTGYTQAANETLVTCAEQNGMKLICVILKEDSPDQFYDTVKLFDYGFSNFSIMNVAENETNYSVESKTFFPTTLNILGSSRQLLEINKDNYIIMPKNISFKELSSELDYNTDNEDEIAKIIYSYHGAYLGYGCVNRVHKQSTITSSFDSSLNTVEEKVEEDEDNIVFINVIYLAIILLGLAFVGIIISYIVSFFVNYNILDDYKEKKSNKRRRSRRNYGDYNW